MATQLSSYTGEKFTMIITNGLATRQTVAILPAYLDTQTVDFVNSATNESNPAAIVAAGYACDAVVDDGTLLTVGQATLAARSSNTKMSIRAFREYIKNFSKTVKTLQVQASNASAFDETLEVVSLTPFTGSKSAYVQLGSLRDRYSNIAEQLDIDASGLVLSFDTLMLLPIPAGVQVTLTFYF